MNKLIYVPMLLLFSHFLVAEAETTPKAYEPEYLKEPPNADYQPAFLGQTRANALKTETPFQQTLIASNLERPWGIANLPDGRLLISEKSGKMKIVNIATKKVEATLSGIPEVYAYGQGGLLGLSISPNFSKDRMIYWVFSEALEQGSLTSVAKGRLSMDEKSIEAAKVIYRAYPIAGGSSHYGGRILFDDTGHLLVSIGERYGSSTRVQAQSSSSALGKIIRITTEGQPAKDNPIFKGKDALKELYSIGHRNPQGLAIHPVSGELWQSELGPRGGDEVNLIKPGLNYGWPVITYGIEYSGGAVGEGIQQEQAMQQPVYYWDPVVSPSGMTFYKGTRIPEWENNLFIAGLAGEITRLVIEANKVLGEERLSLDEKQRFRDIVQGNDGALYAITDMGRLYKIDKK